jgi:hypothetical protein
VLRGAAHAIADRRIDVIQFESNEMNALSRTFFRDYYDALPGYVFYRLLMNGAVPVGAYQPRTHELLFFQNVVAVRHDVSYLSGII